MVRRRLPKQEERRERWVAYVPSFENKSMTLVLTRCSRLALYEADRLAHEEAVMNGGVSFTLANESDFPFRFRRR